MYRNFNEWKNLIPKEILYEYFIVDNHTYNEVMKYFGLSNRILLRLLDCYNITKYKKKETFKSIINRINREEFIEYFIYQNHSKSDTAKHFNISSGDKIFYSVCKYFNVPSKKDKYGELLNSIDLEELYNYYIVEEHSDRECMIKFNLPTISAFYRLCNKYNIFKDNETKNKAKLLSKEDIVQYYIIEEHDLGECLEHFEVTKKVFIYALNYYNIKKYDGNTKERKMIKYINTISKEELQKYYIKENNSIEDTCKKFNIDTSYLFKLFNYYNIHKFNKSKYEKEIKNYLEQYNTLINFNNKRVLKNGQEIDIYFPSYKFGIEFNGTYWHSDMRDNIDKYYHFNKSKAAENNNIKLIHIWEHDWVNKEKQQKIKYIIDNILNTSLPYIDPKYCSIKQISNDEASKLYNIYSLQKYKNCHLIYGLYYNNELIQFIGINKINNYGNYKIILRCTNLNYKISQGYCSLIKYFLNTYNPTYLKIDIKLSDIDNTNYNDLGFTFDKYTDPKIINILDFNNLDISHKNTKEIRLKTIAHAWDEGGKRISYLLKELNNLQGENI